MNPLEPQQIPPAEEPTSTPEATSTPPAPNPPVKSHKKLVIGVVVGAALLFAALGFVAWLLISSILNTSESADDAPKSNATGSISIGDTPEEVYYNNVAVFNGYSQSYDEIEKSEGNTQAALDLVVPGGRSVCVKLKEGTFSRRDVAPLLSTALFATAKDSLCPEHRKDLDTFIVSLDDAATTKDYEKSEAMVLDGTVDVEGMMFANAFCYASAAFYFGPTNTITQEESTKLGETACIAFIGEFDTNIEYYEWSAQKEEERSELLKQLAKKFGVCTLLLCNQ